MKPEDFIHVGIRLAAGSSEADYRSSVSRMYYGLFHLASAALDRCGVALPVNQAHAKLSHCLAQVPDLEVQEAARNLATLRELRCTADYELSDPNPASPNWAQRQIPLVQRTMEALVRWSTSEAFLDSAESIRQYARDVLKLPLRDLK